MPTYSYGDFAGGAGGLGLTESATSGAAEGIKTKVKERATDLELYLKKIEDVSQHGYLSPYAEEFFPEVKGMSYADRLKVINDLMANLPEKDIVDIVREGGLGLLPYVYQMYQARSVGRGGKMSTPTYDLKRTESDVSDKELESLNPVERKALQSYNSLVKGMSLPYTDRDFKEYARTVVRVLADPKARNQFDAKRYAALQNTLQNAANEVWRRYHDENSPYYSNTDYYDDNMNMIARLNNFLADYANVKDKDIFNKGFFGKYNVNIIPFQDDKERANALNMIGVEYSPDEKKQSLLGKAADVIYGLGETVTTQPDIPASNEEAVVANAPLGVGSIGYYGHGTTPITEKKWKLIESTYGKENVSIDYNGTPYIKENGKWRVMRNNDIPIEKKETPKKEKTYNFYGQKVGEKEFEFLKKKAPEGTVLRTYEDPSVFGTSLYFEQTTPIGKKIRVKASSNIIKPLLDTIIKMKEKQKKEKGERIIKGESQSHLNVNPYNQRRFKTLESKPVISGGYDLAQNQEQTIPATQENIYNVALKNLYRG